MSWIEWVVVAVGLGAVKSVSDTVRSSIRGRQKRLKAEAADRRALEAANRPPEPVCGCTHHLAKHDKRGKCHEAVQMPSAWDAKRKPTAYEAGTCNCQQYVGPQPLGRVYAEEIADV
jgi:Arc/MetJ-type ribon-helix-helix transcriptional regulator